MIAENDDDGVIELAVFLQQVEEFAEPSVFVLQDGLAALLQVLRGGPGLSVRIR